MSLTPEFEARCDQLIHRAEGGQWNPEARMDWSAPMRLADVHVMAPLVSERLVAAWPKLPADARAEAVRQLLGSLLGNLAVGEVFVDHTLNALDDLFPHKKLYDVLQWQIVDEVRHAQVLERYVKKIGWDPRTKEVAASRLDAATASARNRWETGSMLVMILEIAATAAIQGLKSYCDEPLTGALLKGIVQDESRHISTQTLALRGYRETFDEETLAAIKDAAVLGWTQALAVTEAPACEMSDLLDRQFATAPATPTTSWPFFRKTLSDILVPKLKLLGFLDADLASRLEAAGCPIPAGALAA